MKKDELTLSSLGKTWLIDLDGTVVKHNGYLIDGHDTFLQGAEEFLKNIPKKDTLIILTAREEKYREVTLSFLEENGIEYDHVIFDLPAGERILVNDTKPKGLETAVAVNIERDKGIDFSYMEDDAL